MHKAQKWLFKSQRVSGFACERIILPHYRCQHTVKGMGSGSCNLLKYQTRLNVMIKWRTLWPMKVSTWDKIRQRDQRQKLQHSQQWDEGQGQKNYKYTASRFQAYRIGIWSTLGQMQITHGLLQCELSCPYWESNPSQNFVRLNLSLLPFTQNTKKLLTTRTPFSLFNCMPVLSSATPGQPG